MMRLPCKQLEVELVAAALFRASFLPVFQPFIATTRPHGCALAESQIVHTLRKPDAFIAPLILILAVMLLFTCLDLPLLQET